MRAKLRASRKRGSVLRGGGVRDDSACFGLPAVIPQPHPAAGGRRCSWGQRHTAHSQGAGKGESVHCVGIVDASSVCFTLMRS